MNRAIGSWVCDSAWQYFKARRFELTVPFPALVRITAVKIEPQFERIKIEGYFVNEYIKEITPPAPPAPPAPRPVPPAF